MQKNNKELKSCWEQVAKPTRPSFELASQQQTAEVSSNIIVIQGYTNGAAMSKKEMQMRSPQQQQQQQWLSSVAETYASIANHEYIFANKFDHAQNEKHANREEQEKEEVETFERVSSQKVAECICNRFLAYANVKWSLSLRKEVFSPREKLDTPSAIDLVFMQIVRDFNANDCIRLSEQDREKLVKFLGAKGLSVAFLYEQYRNFKIKFKRQLIQMAKDTWPLYFCRLFPIEVSLTLYFFSLSVFVNGSKRSF